jgi:hypothetical protein
VSGRTLFEDYHLVRSAEASVAATATIAHTQDIVIRATTMGRNMFFSRQCAALVRRLPGELAKEMPSLWLGASYR